MNHIIPTRLRALNTKLDQIEFAYRDPRQDEEPSTASQVGKATLAVGGAAAVAGGASYLRGRLALRGTGIEAQPGWRGALNVARFGARKLGQDAGAAIGGVKSAAGGLADWLKKRAAAAAV